MAASGGQQQLIADACIIKRLDQFRATATCFATTSPWIQNNTYLRHHHAPLHICLLIMDSSIIYRTAVARYGSLCFGGRGIFNFQFSMQQNIMTLRYTHVRF
jgi:hypothetical protein